MLRRIGSNLGLLCAAVSACGEEQALQYPSDAGTDQSISDEPNDEVTADASPAEAGVLPDTLPGTPMTIEVATTSETFVDLSERTTVRASRSSLSWDLMFDGWKVYTNGGVSGPGDGAVFGPSDPLDLLFDTLPAVPLLQDKARGALTDWFIYANAVVWSRMHVFAIQDGDSYWKLQVLSYYGNDDSGSEVSALIQLRYARVREDGNDETVEVTNLDATSGGYGAVDDTSAGCLNLGTGERLDLDREERLQSSTWHVCFQRTDAFVNGGLSGPANVVAADLDVDSERPLEFDADLDQELRRFEAVDFEALTRAGLSYSEDDRISSLFEDHWVDETGPDAEVLDASWIVRGADAGEHFALLFTGLEGASDASPGTVTVRVKALTPAE